MIADIIAKDRTESDVLVVEVKASDLSEDSIAAILQSQILEYVRATTPTIPFSMIVCLNVIRITEHASDGSPLASRTLETGKILGFYDTKFGEKRIFHDYLEALTDAWLSDLAYHWKSDFPPGSAALDELGLLEKLKGGRTLNEVELAGDSLR